MVWSSFITFSSYYVFLQLGQTMGKPGVHEHPEGKQHVWHCQLCQLSCCLKRNFVKDHLSDWYSWQLKTLGLNINHSRYDVCDAPLICSARKEINALHHLQNDLISCLKFLKRHYAKFPATVRDFLYFM